MSKAKVFMIMPFQDEFFEVYTMLQKEFFEIYEFSNAGEEGNQQNILKDIIQPICEADVILADLTGLNANVLYELGIAHTLNKKCITITKDDLNKLPFDLKQYRSKNYDTHFTKFAELIDYLRKNLKGAIDNTVEFGNPVIDFMKSNDKILIANTNAQASGDVVTDKGFLDYMAEIEEDMNEMTDNITDLAGYMKKMNSSTSDATDRIKNVSGGGKTNFVRKEAKKVAEYTLEFQKSLHNYNSTNMDIWNRIEYNSMGLLENTFICKKSKVEEIVKFVDGFIVLKESIKTSDESVDKFKTTLKSNIGVERSLNQSIRALDSELEVYLTSMEQILASIDRIIDKGNLLKFKLEQ